jgi:DNA-directed RNA polymerase subunit beta'
MPFINGLLKEEGSRSARQFTYLRFGAEMTVTMLDHIKELGFLYATRAGITISIDDLIVPPGKARLCRSVPERSREGGSAVSRRCDHER